MLAFGAEGFNWEVGNKPVWFWEGNFRLEKVIFQWGWSTWAPRASICGSSLVFWSRLQLAAALLL